MIPTQIDFLVLKITFKEFLNKRMLSNFQINIKMKQELRQSIESTKVAIADEPNDESHFLKYVTTL